MLVEECELMNQFNGGMNVIKTSNPDHKSIIDISPSKVWGENAGACSKDPKALASKQPRKRLA